MITNLKQRDIKLVIAGLGWADKEDQRLYTTQLSEINFDWECPKKDLLKLLSIHGLTLVIQKSVNDIEPNFSPQFSM